MLCYPGAAEEEEDVETDVEKYVAEFYAGKAHGFVAKSQIGKGDVGEGVDGYCHSQHPHKHRMLRQEQRCGYRGDEDAHQDGEEYGGDGYTPQGGGVYALGVGFATGVAEETGLHAVIQNDEGHGRKTVEIAHDTILSGREKIYIKWHETPVEKSSHYTAEAVYGSVFGQGFKL